MPVSDLPSEINRSITYMEQLVERMTSDRNQPNVGGLNGKAWCNY